MCAVFRAHLSFVAAQQFSTCPDVQAMHTPQDAQSHLVAPNKTLPTGTVDVSGGWMAGGAGGTHRANQAFSFIYHELQRLDACVLAILVFVSAQERAGYCRASPGAHIVCSCGVDLIDTAIYVLSQGAHLCRQHQDDPADGVRGDDAVLGPGAVQLRLQQCRADHQRPGASPGEPTLLFAATPCCIAVPASMMLRL